MTGGIAMRKFVGVLAAAVVLAVPGSAWALTAVPSIQGGTVPSAGAWPWMVSVVGVDSSGNVMFLCSGELIGPTTVLTAAHCLDPDQGTANYVVSSAQDNLGAWLDTPPQFASPYEIVNASAAVANPGWNFNSNVVGDYDDVGIIRLSAPLPGASWLPVVQPDQVAPFETAAGFSGLAAGYGITSPNGQVAGQLYQAVISHAYIDFNDPNGGAAETTGSLFDYYNPGNRGTCEGDSGGPLLVPIGGGAPPVSTNPSPSNGDWAVVGITHAGPSNECNDGEYMNVAYDGAGSATNDVAAWLAPYETPFDYAAPSVSGDPVVGNPLTCEPGTWAEPAASFAYAWETVGAGGATPINGADEQSYTPEGTDLGSRLECAVTATVPGFGSTNSATSGPVTVTPASLSLTPAAQRVVPGDAVDYSAEGLDAGGNDLGDVTAATTFSIAPDGSGSATGASCLANGCQATVAGTYLVTGTDGAATGSTTMIVVAGMPTSLSLSPFIASVASGVSQVYQAEGFDFYGNDAGDVTAVTSFSIAPSGGTGSQTGASCSGDACSATVPGTYIVTGIDTQARLATGIATLTVTAGTSVSTSLSGDGQSGADLSVPSGTAVSDQASLSGADAASATGTVTYNVYFDSDCSTLAGAGSPETITTPGVLPASEAETLSTPGTYYWQATYSGDSTNAPSTSPCGGEVETVTPVAEPTSLSGSLSGDGQMGAAVSVPSGTAVSDQASLSGMNAASATGTVTYNVYFDSNCSTLAGAGSPETITTPGMLPASEPETLSTPGTYYWQATYSGDPYNEDSTSACGSLVETVTAVSTPTSVSTSLSGGGQAGAAVSVPSGTAVSDQASLSGVDAASATGTVTYACISIALLDPGRRGVTGDDHDPGGAAGVRGGDVEHARDVLLAGDLQRRLDQRGVNESVWRLRSRPSGPRTGTAPMSP